MAAENGALACVIGTMDLVRPLGLAGIRSAVVSRAGDPTRFSRFVVAAVEWVDPWEHPEELVERLVEFGAAQRVRPVLFYEGDWDLLVVSRYRDRLQEGFRFVIPAPDLVEALVDKARFNELSVALGLPVPASYVVSTTSAADTPKLDLRFPLILKPLTRQTQTWATVVTNGMAKAIRVDREQDLEALWPRIVASGVDVVAQELISGGEERIESYHAYVDASGDVVGEFTGRKLRTYPPMYGFSTALEITEIDDVAALGRDTTSRLGLRGVLKADFKRAPDGRLYLLEINPRFNLWHHLGAKAGVNLPELVYRDLVGWPRRANPHATPGARWCWPWQDVRSARAAGIPLGRWLMWAARCDAKSVVAWDDPMPFVRGLVLPRIARVGRRGLARNGRSRAEPAKPVAEHDSRGDLGGRE